MDINRQIRFLMNKTGIKTVEELKTHLIALKPSFKQDKPNLRYIKFLIKECNYDLKKRNKKI